MFGTILFLQAKSVLHVATVNFVGVNTVAHVAHNYALDCPTHPTIQVPSFLNYHCQLDKIIHNLYPFLCIYVLLPIHLNCAVHYILKVK